MKIARRIIPAIVGLGVIGAAMTAKTRQNVADEVAWVVGDEAIFLSDIEALYTSMKQEGTPIEGDPYCVLPEQIAVEKLYLHQAKLDTIEAPESQVSASVDRRLNFFIDNLGSKERVEEYFHKPMSALRQQLLDMVRTDYIISQVQSSLTKNLKVTPSDVRKYYSSLPEDSIPYVPEQVEVQIVEVFPTIPQEEIDDVKARLRDYAERVNSGETSFSTLAILHSEDGSRMQGGELGFHNRADWVPEFSNVAFSLNEPGKVSRIVETEYGYHIIQLIEKRGEQVNVRHILLRPHVSTQDLTDAMTRLDSVRSKITSPEIFADAARLISQDKDSRNNKGIMVNQNTGSSRFELKDLPPEVASQVETMQIGDISSPFIMIDRKSNRDAVAIVRLKERVEGHKATLSEDYNMLKEMATNAAREEIIRKWVEEKIRNTYVRIEDGWEGCEYKYSGWVK